MENEYKKKVYILDKLLCFYFSFFYFNLLNFILFLNIIVIFKYFQKYINIIIIVKNLFLFLKVFFIFFFYFKIINFIINIKKNINNNKY